MSLHPNAPYRDRLEDDGSTLIYEGHDVPRTKEHPDPKHIDQPAYHPSGALTENGKFQEAAHDYKCARRQPARVRAYEKLRQGIWSYNGLFHLVDSWQEHDGKRKVFKFKLVAVEDDEQDQERAQSVHQRRRLIPTPVKLEVWKRDEGKCIRCGATNELHFDHVVPYSKGGSSITAENVQLLCARHNLEKRDKIE